MAVEIPSPPSGGVEFDSGVSSGLPDFQTSQNSFNVFESVTAAFEGLKTSASEIERDPSDEISPQNQSPNSDSNSNSELENRQVPAENQGIPFPSLPRVPERPDLTSPFAISPLVTPLLSLRSPALLRTSSIDPEHRSSFLLSPTALVSPSEGVTSTNVGLGCLPGQSRDFYKRKGSDFTLMVAGASGSGKTTFINTLFGDQLIQSDPEIARTADINTHQFHLVENGYQLNFTAVDTPGFGNHIDNRLACFPLVNYVEDQFTSYMYQTEQPERSKHTDTRVHCCLYFITPSGTELTPLDVLTMKELSKRVNVIPVISKSDTLSTEDLLTFKKMVRESLITNAIGVCEFIVDTSVVESINEIIPFSIIGSNQVHFNDKGVEIRGRKYKWGMAEVENVNHCDFLALRALLMSTNMLDLINSTDVHFENFRSESLMARSTEVLKRERGLELDFLGNGLAQYSVYNKLPIQAFKETLKVSDTLYNVLEQMIKEKSSSTARHQEVRFKDWKKGLVKTQVRFNDEIQQLHQIIGTLKADIEVLGLSKNVLPEELAQHIKKQKAFEPIETSSLQDEEFVF